MAAAAADRPVVEVRGTGDLADGTYTFTQIVNGGRAFKHTAKPLAIHVYNIEIARRNDRYWLLGECASASGYGISKILYYCPIKDRTVVAEGGLPPSEGWEVCTREKSIRGSGEGNPPLVRSGRTVEEAAAAMAGAGVMLGLVCALEPAADATLEEIANTLLASVTLAEQRRDAALLAQRQVILDAEAAVASARAALDEANAQHAEILAEHTALVDVARCAADDAAARRDTFRARVCSDGLDALDVADVYQLLRILGVQVPMATLQKEEVSGIVLEGLTEAEMVAVFAVKTLGERRRLFNSLRRLANRQGFGQPGTLEWDVERVCTWLAEEGLVSLQSAFRAESVNGEVLLTLTRDDLDCLGVSTLGGKANLIKKIEGVKKQHFAGQIVRPLSAAGGVDPAGAHPDSSAPGLTDEQQRLVLEQVLAENAELASRLKSMRDKSIDRAPLNFCCPITTEVMEDPVFAMDGHTYEREAITAWFRRHDTSPLTREIVPPTLVPNVNLRSQIMSWNDTRDS